MPKMRTWYNDHDLARSMGLHEYPHTAELCRAIAASGLSQAELARRANISQGSISELLAGLHPISYEKGRRLAKAVENATAG